MAPLPLILKTIKVIRLLKRFPAIMQRLEALEKRTMSNLQTTIKQKQA